MNIRKQEERNEKIIRGLMKLPPNRRCINCNSLGPQYVCTNFWTFVCITCSGIHREFTHRVKSVSMATFTSQEVEALQKGGNQRAREIYLKDWDLQRQRLPDNSNIERVREFIKNVYVNRQYAGGKVSDKPPRDMQILRNHEDETRRASSYHSYSQSPPYENQYEERKYGKQLGVLSRKPGSDRGYYEGKITSFPYSPGRLAEQMYEERFANEGSVSRVSDYSVSSSGDPFRSDNPSPTFQGKRYSPPMHRLKDESVEVTHSRTVSDPYIKRALSGLHTQKTASSSSFDSFDSNSVNSGSIIDAVSEPERYGGTQIDGKASASTFQKSAFPVNAEGFDPFSLQSKQQPGGFSAPSIDLFEKPANANAAAHAQELFKPADITSAPPLDLFSDSTHQNLATVTSEQQPPIVSFPLDEGWATFDVPQQNTPTFETKSVPHASSIPTSDQISLMNSSAQLPSVSYDSHGTFSSVESQWHGGGHGIHQFGAPTSTKGGLSSFPTEPTSTNPFDLPYDSNDANTVLLNMSSLQASLPDPQFPPYVEDFNQQWFPPNSATSYPPVAPQGGLTCMTAEGPTAQFSNIPPQSSVASFSGNPFA